MAHENATPRPWTVERNTYGVTVRRPSEYGSTPICEIWANGDDREANAALIVEAVNAYDTLRAENERLTRERDEARDDLAKLHRGCDWYWPADDTEASVCSAYEAYEQACGWEGCDGTVIEIARGGIVEHTWCAALPAADDSDSDNEFWVEEASETEAQAKIDAERQRRAALSETQP